MWNNSATMSPVVSVRMKSHSAALQQVMSSTDWNKPPNPEHVAAIRMLCHQKN